MSREIATTGPGRRPSAAHDPSLPDAARTSSNFNARRRSAGAAVRVAASSDGDDVAADLDDRRWISLAIASIRVRNAAGVDGVRVLRPGRQQAPTRGVMRTVW
jgi:hypothetical protein